MIHIKGSVSSTELPPSSGPPPLPSQIFKWALTLTTTTSQTCTTTTQSTPHHPEQRIYPASSTQPTHRRTRPPQRPPMSTTTATFTTRTSDTSPPRPHRGTHPQSDGPRQLTQHPTHEDEDDDASNSNNHYDSYASPFSQRASRYVRDPYSRTSPIYTYSSYHYPTSTYSYASPSTSSSPVSYSSDETALNDSPSDGSPLSDEPLPLHRRDEKKMLSESVEEVPTRRSIESARSEARTLAPGNNDAEEEEEEEQQEEFTPTCTQALKRQWSCIALRWRLGVFRAKKKVRRRLSAVVHQ
ncbi:hypothetical protein AB1N83_014346 [Pleurotus pulmonarius]